MSKVVRFTFRALSPATLFPESYTIFGAICWGIKILFGEKDLKEILERFKESPLFILSSPLFITPYISTYRDKFRKFFGIFCTKF
ncbi:MAG TPA: hypothetical protein EYP32_06725, partial [Aquificaceae bacterium]|nr:hypothetical protein [Aquificaceae bacterium]